MAATRSGRQSEPVHDLNKLLAHILAPLHCPCLNKILVAPLVLETVHLPCFVDSEHGQVVAIFVVKFGALLVSQLLLLSRAIEDILNRQHGHNGNYFFRAPQVNRCQDHFSELRLKWELSHDSSELGKQAFIV